MEKKRKKMKMAHSDIDTRYVWIVKRVVKRVVKRAVKRAVKRVLKRAVKQQSKHTGRRCQNARPNWRTLVGSAQDLFFFNSRKLA